MKNINILFLVIVLLSCSGISEAGFTGRLTADYLSNSNVYGDSRAFNDNGMNLNLALNFMGKLGENTYPRLKYAYTYLNYPVYNLENKNTGNLNASLRQRLGELFTLGIEGGQIKTEMPFSIQYNSDYTSVMPFIKIYPTYMTEVEVGAINRQMAYPGYDLDYAGLRNYVSIEQGMPLDTTLSILAGSGTRDYSERKLYDTTTSTYPVLTTNPRKDSDSSYLVELKKDIGEIGFTLGYYYEMLDSNANDFYWGDYATSGDEQILADFWNYSLTNLSLTIKSGEPENIMIELYGHTENKMFDGWYARDVSETILTPLQFRRDQQTAVSIKIEKELVEHLSLNIKYLYKNNASNDAPYNYTQGILNAGIKYYF